MAWASTGDDWAGVGYVEQSDRRGIRRVRRNVEVLLVEQGEPRVGDVRRGIAERSRRLESGMEQGLPEGPRMREHEALELQVVTGRDGAHAHQPRQRSEPFGSKVPS